MSSASSIQGLVSPGGTAGSGVYWGTWGEAAAAAVVPVVVAVVEVLVRGSVETKYIIKALKIIATASLRHRDKGVGLIGPKT